jgi:hypothetical protein
MRYVRLASQNMHDAVIHVEFYTVTGRAASF